MDNEVSVNASVIGGVTGFKSIQADVNRRAISSNRDAFPVAFIIGRPHEPIVRDSILPNLKEWHYRSGEYIDLYCVGFCDPQATPSPILSTSGTVAEAWKYDGEEFAKAVESFEANTSWKYSGRTDFILATAVYNRETGETHIDWKAALPITLERWLERKRFGSVPEFIENVLLFATLCEGKDVAVAFSDKMGGRGFVKVLCDILVSLLPAQLKDAINSGKVSFLDLLDTRVQDLSREELEFVVQHHQVEELKEIRPKLLTTTQPEFDQIVGEAAIMGLLRGY